MSAKAFTARALRLFVLAFRVCKTKPISGSRPSFGLLHWVRHPYVRNKANFRGPVLLCGLPRWVRQGAVAAKDVVPRGISSRAIIA